MGTRKLHHWLREPLQRQGRAVEGTRWELNVKTRHFFLQLSRKHPRLLTRGVWAEWDVPEGWLALVAHLVERIDAAILSNADTERFEFIDMVECSSHLVVIASYPRHLDPAIDDLLVAAGDASEGVCMHCGSCAVTTTPLCSARHVCSSLGASGGYS